MVVVVVGEARGVTQHLEGKLHSHDVVVVVVCVCVWRGGWVGLDNDEIGGNDRRVQCARTRCWIVLTFVQGRLGPSAVRASRTAQSATPLVSGGCQVGGCLQHVGITARTPRGKLVLCTHMRRKQANVTGEQVGMKRGVTTGLTRRATSSSCASGCTS